MILVDTSVWIDHFRHGDSALAGLLEAGQVFAHPFIVGELALGNLRQRDVILDMLNNLPKARIAADEEVMTFVARNKLHGLGIGYVDAHLLASARLSPSTQLWSRDKRFCVAAQQLGLLASFGH